MTLIVTMLVLSSIFMAVMAHSLIQGHNSIAFEFKLKVKLSSLYAQSEDDQIEKYGKAHCIVMDLADALGSDDKATQFRQTQTIFNQAENYKKVFENRPVDLSSITQRPSLRAVK